MLLMPRNSQLTIRTMMPGVITAPPLNMVKVAGGSTDAAKVTPDQTKDIFTTVILRLLITLSTVFAGTGI